MMAILFYGSGRTGIYNYMVACSSKVKGLIIEVDYYLTILMR